MALCSRLGLHIPCPAAGYQPNPFLTSRTESELSFARWENSSWSGWDYISLALPRAIIRILSSPLELKASFRSLVEKILRDPVGIRTQDPQLRRLLLYPAELPDHPLMDLVSFSQASSTRSFTYGSATQNIMHGHMPTQFADAKVRFFSEPHK